MKINFRYEKLILFAQDFFPTRYGYAHSITGLCALQEVAVSIEDSPEIFYEPRDLAPPGPMFCYVINLSPKVKQLTTSK